MPRLKIDVTTRVIAVLSVAFGLIALILACIGIGTPNWFVGYANDPSNGNQYQRTSANFFYSCDYQIGGATNLCVARDGGQHYYPSFSGVPWYFDYINHMRDAGALCIVGIIFLAFGIVMTLVMLLDYLPMWLYFLPPGALFLACLFMVAGMAEGSRFMLYNGYSVNLYQTAHVVTIFSLFMSAFAAGRIHFARWSAADINRTVK